MKNKKQATVNRKKKNNNIAAKTTNKQVLGLQKNRYLRHVLLQEQDGSHRPGEDCLEEHGRRRRGSGMVGVGEAEDGSRHAHTQEHHHERLSVELHCKKENRDWPRRSGTVWRAEEGGKGDGIERKKRKQE